MQPRKALAASKIAPLASVTAAASVSKARWNGRASVRDLPATSMLGHRDSRPERPMSQQAAHDPHRTLASQFEPRQQVEEDVIVIAGVQRDLAGTA